MRDFFNKMFNSAVAALRGWAVVRGVCPVCGCHEVAHLANYFRSSGPVGGHVASHHDDERDTSQVHLHTKKQ
jgi:hypothetical protein